MISGNGTACSLKQVPIILFAYARPQHLLRTLDSLRANRIPMLYVFSDGPKSPDKGSMVAQVRAILRAIDWCEVVLCEREQNLGLGQSILTGVTEVLKQHDTVIVFEDDLVCVPGTYEYLCAALDYYRDDLRVMSVTGWTHPKVTPRGIINQPYFDGRAECWVWGTWARAWGGVMEHDAKMLIGLCRQQGIDIYRYGADLPAMAKVEKKQNIWAVRWLYWHILHGGLCLRPPWSMVEHIGFDAEATNTAVESWFKNPPLKPAPPIPAQWPAPAESPELSQLWQAVCGKRPSVPRVLYRFVRHIAGKALRLIRAR